jgi:hypothetical protein
MKLKSVHNQIELTSIERTALRHMVWYHVKYLFGFAIEIRIDEFMDQFIDRVIDAIYEDIAMKHHET